MVILTKIPRKDSALFGLSVIWWSLNLGKGDTPRIIKIHVGHKIYDYGHGRLAYISADCSVFDMVTNCWLLSAVLDLFPRLVPVFFKNHQAKPPPFFLSRVTKGLTKIGQSCVWFAAIFIRWDAPWTSQILSNLSLSGWSPWWRVARSWDLPWPMRVRRGCLRNFKRFSPWVRSFQKDKHIAKSRVVFASQTFFVGWQQWFNDSRIFFG